MKKLLKLAFYLAWFAVPGLIVQYYSAFVDPMTPEEIRGATMAGTVAMIILAVLTGFGGLFRRGGSSRKAPSVPAAPRTRIIRDPATGAERLYNWNDKMGQWESDDGLSVLDESRTEEWERQRRSDRRWADDQMNKLRNRDTAFDRDMDEMVRRRKKEMEDMERQMEQSRRFGERHGKWDLTEQEQRDFLSRENNENWEKSLEWKEYADEYDRIVDRIEWIQWGADFAMDVADILSFGTGKPIKYAYIASRNAAGDLIDGLIHRRSLSGIAARTATKTFIDIGQDNVSKIGYKYVSNGVGDGVKEALQNYDEGKSASEGFVSGFLKGTTRTGVEHGLSNVKFKWNAKQTEIAQKATKQSSRILGQQQAGQVSEKLGNALRNNVRTRAAQQIAAETAKQKDLLSAGIGKMTDGLWNQALN